MKLFSRRELILFLSVFLLVLILALTITVSVSLSKRNRDDSRAHARVSGDGFVFEDFLFPEDYSEPWHMDWRLHRERLERWDSETVARFSQDIPGIILEILKEDNTQRLLNER